MAATGKNRESSTSYGTAVRIGVLIVGALFWTWINLFHDIGRASSFLMADAYVADRPFGTYLNCLASPLGFAIGSLAAFAMNRRSPTPRAAGFYAMLIGCALLHVSFYATLALSGSYIPASIASCSATALGSLLFLRFAPLAFDLEKGDIAFLAIAGFAAIKLAAPFGKAILTADAVTAACLFHLAFLALFAALFVFMAKRQGVGHGRSSDVSSERACDQAVSSLGGRPLPWSLFVHLVCYGAGFGIIHGMRGFGNSEGLDLTLLGFFEIPLMATLVLLCMWKVSRTEVLWQRVRGVVFPVVVVSYSLLPISLSPFIPSLVAEMAGGAYSALFILGCFIMASETKIPLALVASLGCFFKCAGFFLGVLFGYVFGGEGFFADQTDATIMFIAVFAVFCAGTFWIGSEQSMRKWWGLRQEMTPERHHMETIRSKCAMLARAYKLSPREEEILLMLVNGKRAAQIKEECNLSLFTVRNHIQNVYRKFDVHSINELESLVEDAEAAAL